MLNFWRRVYICVSMRGYRKFCQRGSKFDNVFFSFSWWGDRELKYHYKWAIIGPPAKRHRNGVSLACRWWPNIECLLFQGIRTSIVKTPSLLIRSWSQWLICSIRVCFNVFNNVFFHIQHAICILIWQVKYSSEYSLATLYLLVDKFELFNSVHSRYSRQDLREGAS